MAAGRRTFRGVGGPPATGRFALRRLGPARSGQHRAGRGADRQRRPHAAAVDAWKRQDADRLRALIEAEAEGRERQLEISGRIGFGGGVNPILVSEDIQNMRLYLACPDFPQVPDEHFHVTANPYST